MKIAVINLTGGGMSGGYRKYLCSIIPRLARHRSVSAILCATPVSVKIETCFESLQNVRFIPCQPRKALNRDHDLELLSHLEKFGPDVVYVPVERPFRLGTTPVVNMVQNMEPFVHPYNGNPLSEKIKNWFRIRQSRRALAGADRVIAVSEFVRNHLVRRCGIADRKIGVVYHGWANSGQKASALPVRIPGQWQNRFFFAAGSIRPARGLTDILAAMSHLKTKFNDLPGLVIAGGADPAMGAYAESLRTWVEKNNLTSHIIWAGHLDEMKMEWCYRNCLAFVMTSRVESFGMTALEAMAHGCISISADNPCLPEIFGKAAIYYKPMDTEALSKALAEIISISDFEREESARIARERALCFTWDDCAERTAAELKMAISGT